ncbi:MAG: hypothetical protein HY816_07030 [Candidatus Wallbacteria bacterium]|nr:hypothetical protein [Candidatus Wallbacteria bacterium]
MNEEQHSRESRAGLEQEMSDLKASIARLARRRLQLFLMLLPFVVALAGVGYLACMNTFEVIKSPDANPKAWFELVFWTIIMSLVVYVVVIVARERTTTIVRLEESERRQGKLQRRFQQLALEEAGVRPHEGSAAAHAHASREAAQRVMARGEHPAAAPASGHAPPATAAPRPVDRGPIVLDLDAAADTKECPMCAETVRAKAKICRFCRYEFEALGS